MVHNQRRRPHSLQRLTVHLLIVLLLWVCGASLHSAGAQSAAAPAPATPTSPEPVQGLPPADAAGLMKSERFRRLAAELRCLVCQNQSLVDSNAPLAQDLRQEVVKLMASGRDDQQIKSFLVDRYGEFVLYRPAISMRNALLWFGPFMLLALGALAWWRLGRRRPAPVQSAQAALRQVDELLER